MGTVDRVIEGHAFNKTFAIALSGKFGTLTSNPIWLPGVHLDKALVQENVVPDIQRVSSCVQTSRQSISKMSTAENCSETHF
jgi:hypothetical protein